MLLQIEPFCENLSVYSDLSAEYAKRERFVKGEDMLDSTIQDQITRLEILLRLLPYERECEFQKEMSKMKEANSKLHKKVSVNLDLESIVKGIEEDAIKKLLKQAYDMKDLHEKTRDAYTEKLLETKTEQNIAHVKIKTLGFPLLHEIINLIVCSIIFQCFLFGGQKFKLFLMLLVQRAFSIWMEWKNFVEFKSPTRFEFDLIGEFDQTLKDIQWICFYYLLIFGDPGQENPQRRKYSVNRKSRDDDPMNIFNHCLLGEKEKLKRTISKYGNFININEVHEGNTALHLAVHGNHLDVVQFLLYTFRGQLNFNIENEEGYNPLDLAILRKLTNIANTIIRHRNANPQLSSLRLAVETEQAGIAKALIPKCEILQKELEDLVVPLTRFCDLAFELKRKDLQKEHRRITQKNFGNYKESILVRLVDYKIR